MGGWNQTEDEFNQVIFDSFKSPRFVFLHVFYAGQATFRQLIHTDVGRLFYNQVKAGVNVRTIKRRYPYEYNAFRHSFQNTDRLSFDFINTVRYFVLAITTLILIVFLSQWKRIKPIQMKWALLMLLVLLIVNAAFTSGLAGVSHRYQGRIIWLLPFFVLILIINQHSLIKEFFKKSEIQKE